MYELTCAQLSHVNGGVACIDKPMFDKLQQQAVRSGVVWTAIATPIVSTVLYSVTENPALTLGTALFMAPYTFMVGYAKSSAWKIIE